ncbi:MAG: xylose isomerase [Actinobacteria bacterium 69-20]|jgi:sugar phosphate isomerase/epimerase|nr:sugar phosphate isomerase/epimerase [Actinomycetota bacterium]OJV23625.1 MAG: xylose isomerase [Actinobacteria bacterium 69-20]
MTYVADDWRIATAMLPFPNVTADGRSVQDVDASYWCDVFREVADAGFRDVDLTDCWVRIGDLSPSRLDEFATAMREADVVAAGVSAIRCSVIDSHCGDENLAYSHRTIDAAAHLGCAVVSVGLHQQLTPAQKRRLWFWTLPGHVDPADDADTWRLAVRRLRELGEHAAEVGLLLSLEMYEDTYLGTADSSVRLVEDIGLSNVGLNPDLGNLVRLNRPVESWHEMAVKTLPYTNYWHVKNYLRYEDPDRDCYLAMPATLQDGVINYRELIRLATAVGFQGIICTEHYGGDGLSVCAANREYLRSRILPARPDYRLGESRVLQVAPVEAATGDGQAVKELAHG